MTADQVRRLMVGFWLILLNMGLSALSGEIGGLQGGLLTLLILVGAQMGYGVLCRRFGKEWAGIALRLGPLLLVPAMLLSRGLTSDLLAVVMEACNLVASLDWSDDDIGGWGQRRWAQVRQAARRFSRPVMGGLTSGSQRQS